MCIRKDGSIHLNHGRDGKWAQGLFQKVHAQVAASRFWRRNWSAVKINRNGQRVKCPTRSATAASSGADLKRPWRCKRLPTQSATAIDRPSGRTLSDNAESGALFDAARLQNRGARPLALPKMRLCYENRVSLSSTGYLQDRRSNGTRHRKQGPARSSIFRYGAAVHRSGDSTR